MNISKNFFSHHKTRKLQKLLGNDGVLSLLKLWNYAETARPDGRLTNMSAEDIEFACDTCGGHEGVFVRTLVEIGFIDEIDGVLVLHDWEAPHPQPLSINGEGSEDSVSETLSDAGRVGALRRWNPEAYNSVESYGNTNALESGL